MKKAALICALLIAAGLSGCQSTTADSYRADTYTASQINRAQEVRSVEILAVMPARVKVNNEKSADHARTQGLGAGALAGAALGAMGGHHNRGSHMLVGALIGAVAGTMVGDAASGGSEQLVDGVQLTYRYNGKLYNSAQVGNACEYKPGVAVMVSGNSQETRIQPNNPYGCAQQKK